MVKSKICVECYKNKVGPDIFGKKWEKGLCDHCGTKRTLVIDSDLDKPYTDYSINKKRGRKYG